MFLRTSGRPRNGCPAGEGPWIRRSRLEHASSCTGEIRSCKDLPDSPPMEPVVYFPEIICFVRSWPTRAGTVRRRTTAVHLSTSLKSVAEARETAERRSRKLSLDQSTRARGAPSAWVARWPWPHGLPGPGIPGAAPLFTQAWGLAHAKGGRDRRHYQGGHDLDDPAAGNRRDGSRDGHEHRLVAGDAPPSHQPELSAWNLREPDRYRS